MAKLETFVATDVASEGGPGAPPYPWEIQGNQITFDGAILVPSTVVSGNTGPGTINCNALFIQGVPIGQHAVLPVSDTPPTIPAPVNGNLWFNSANAQLYIYYNDGTSSQWVICTNLSSSAVITLADAPPSNPTVGQMWFDTVKGSLYLWYDDGTSQQWVVAINQGGAFLSNTGGIVTGPVFLAPASGDSDLYLNKHASGNSNNIIGQTNSVNRWTLQLGGPIAESGGNAGSGFNLIGYQDNGTTSFTTMSAARSTNVVTFTNAIVNGSDVRIKENVEPIQDALDKVLNLDGKRFNRKGHETKELGFIAQDVEKVIPEVVVETTITVEQAGGDKNDKSYILGIQYGQIAALLVEAIKELTGRIELLEEKLNNV